jgi:hypothetical protein
MGLVEGSVTRTHKGHPLDATLPRSVTVRPVLERGTFSHRPYTGNTPRTACAQHPAAIPRTRLDNTKRQMSYEQPDVLAGYAENMPGPLIQFCVSTI